MRTDEVKQRMRALRQFYVSSAMLDVAVLALCALAWLRWAPGPAGLAVLAALMVPLTLWHQRWVNTRMRCPACDGQLQEWDGFESHARTCRHCGIALR